jgi:hypothetical protein
MGAIKTIKALMSSLFYAILSIIIPMIMVTVGANMHYSSNDTELYRILIIIPIGMNTGFVYLAIQQVKTLNKIRYLLMFILIIIGITMPIVIFFIAGSVNVAINAG